MSRKAFIALALALLGAGALSSRAAEETHANLQGVTAAGTSAWTAPAAPFDPPFTLRGVLVCNPDEMLDATPRFVPYTGPQDNGRMGAEWQVTIQAVEPGDRGGTTCWMGQNYGNQPWIRNSDFSYSDEAWVAEILRLSFDPLTLHPFRAGDLIEVTVRQAVFYGGKRNINEGHDVDPAFNFELRLVTADHGLPAPEILTLADVMEAGGSASDRSTWLPIFDQTRATGGEHYQGMRARLNNLTLVTSNGWNPTNTWGNRLCTVTDGAGRFFSLRHPRYSLGEAPTNRFDAVGIFTQESGASNQGTNGYELFVQQVIPQDPPTLAGASAIVLRWPANGTIYQLESRPNLSSTHWFPVTNRPVIMDGQNTVLVPPVSEPQQFYRLRKTN